jgi:DUF1365 family protein
MNPVSFYYCFDRSGARVEALVAEVNNTPWGERHCYVMRSPRGGRGALRARTPKELHVSPFMGMQMDYAWWVGEPGSRLDVRIACHEPDGAPVFEAGLEMSQRELTARSRARALLRYPLMTAQVVAAIYWQALRLWLEGAPFHPHPRTAHAAMQVPS